MGTAPLREMQGFIPPSNALSSQPLITLRTVSSRIRLDIYTRPRLPYVSTSVVYRRLFRRKEDQNRAETDHSLTSRSSNQVAPRPSPPEWNRRRSDLGGTSGAIEFCEWIAGLGSILGPRVRASCLIFEIRRRTTKHET